MTVAAVPSKRKGNYYLLTAEWSGRKTITDDVRQRLLQTENTQCPTEFIILVEIAQCGKEYDMIWYVHFGKWVSKTKSTVNLLQCFIGIVYQSE